MGLWLLGRVEEYKEEERRDWSGGAEGVPEDRKGSVWQEERQNRDVEKGRGRGGGVEARHKREVETGNGGRGEKGNSVMGCRMLMELD